MLAVSSVCSVLPLASLMLHPSHGPDLSSLLSPEEPSLTVLAEGTPLSEFNIVPPFSFSHFIIFMIGKWT